VKWVNDTLDDIPCLSRQLLGAALGGPIAASHDANISALRVIESARLEEAVDCATWRPGGVRDAPTADDWGVDQTAGVTHMIHTFDILRLSGAMLDLEAATVQAEATFRHGTVEVLAVNGPSHEDCLEHVARRVTIPLRRQALIVTRDPHNAPRLKKQASFLRPTSEPSLGAESSIIDARATQITLSFRELMDMYLGATSVVQLGDALYARLAS